MQFKLLDNGTTEVQTVACYDNEKSYFLTWLEQSNISLN